ncbi:hypothetical protein HQ602_17270 [Rhodococcus kroppenstedtii]|nr:hypothetical protein [Rhodococcus kroppenstedtii]MBY6438127.1 hypothetical protein [Rhodococcus kroppenstedtii]
MTHYAARAHYDHDWIAEQIEAELVADTAGGNVIAGPWPTAPDQPDAL